jgi:hypothetical protein
MAMSSALSIKIEKLTGSPFTPFHYYVAMSSSRDFEEKHFTKVRKLDNRSNRWVVLCNECNEQLERRGKKLLEHLGTCSKCPQTDPVVRQRALVHLSESSGILPATAPVLAVLTSAQTEGNEPNAIIEPLPKKARLSGQTTMNTFLDRPMTSEEADGADLAFLRYVFELVCCLPVQNRCSPNLQSCSILAITICTG